jgi:hypothetical protein
MHTEITFSMDAGSRAPHIMGAWLVARPGRYAPHWFDRDGRAYVTMTVRSSVAEQMVTKVCAMHPSLRLVRREVVPMPA